TQDGDLRIPLDRRHPRLLELAGLCPGEEDQGARRCSRCVGGRGRAVGAARNRRRFTFRFESLIYQQRIGAVTPKSQPPRPPGILRLLPARGPTASIFISSARSRLRRHAEISDIERRKEWRRWLLAATQPI